MWQVDFKKLIVWLTPTFLRKANFLLLVQSVNWPLRQKYDDFLRFVDQKQYRLSHNSQVCYLRAVLNDAFDYSLRRIYIDDFDGLNKLYLWRESDRRDIDLTNPVFLYPDNFYGDSGVDFTVFIPATIVTSESENAYLTSLLNEYKTPGKQYNIKRF